MSVRVTDLPEPFISEHSDGWYVYDPSTRDDGFGPLTMEEAEAIKHVRGKVLKHGRHSFQSCPINSRAMCWVLPQTLASALDKCPELRLVLDR